MMAEKIKILLTKTGMTVPQLAEKQGKTRQNLYKKLRQDNFSEDELQEIAKLTGAELEINFIINRNGKIEKI